MVICNDVNLPIQMPYQISLQWSFGKAVCLSSSSDLKLGGKFLLNMFLDNTLQIKHLGRLD